MKKVSIVYAFVLLLGPSMAFGQDFSNKGKDFWLGYGYHEKMLNSPANGGSQDMKLYFTSDKNANVIIEIPGVAYSRTYSVIANQVTVSDPIPKFGAQDARILNAGVYDRGIHVTSDVPIVAYAHIYNQSVSGASLLFPTNTLGKDYYSVNFTQSSNARFSNSFFFVVATEDNTTIEIIPSAPTVNGLSVGQPTQIPLNKGQIYNVMGSLSTINNTGSDLTGSRIRSISTNGSVGCKKIAVFSGSGKISIGGSSNGNAGGSADNLFAQAFPAVAWGKKYLTVPTGSQPNNFYRICVTDPTTVVKLNGQILPATSLINNFYYQFKNNNASGSTSPAEPNLIESDKPILVAQYCTTQGVEGNLNTAGDPEMIYLSPVEQTINQITLYSTEQYRITQSFINVIIKSTGVASFTIDGVSKTSFFQPHPQDNSYSYAALLVPSGSHTLYSDTGFNAIAYGFGIAESYGYNAGTNVRDFSAVTVFQNPYKRLDSSVTCINTPILFSVPFSFVPSSIKWDFSAAPNISPNTLIGPLTTFSSDSTKPVNGQTISYYSPGQSFTFSNVNTSALRDTIKLYTTSATPDGCGSTDQLYAIPVIVRELPTAKFSIQAGACINDPVSFTDQSSMEQGSLTRWLWDFGDGTNADLGTATVQAKTYNSPASYTIKLKVISDIGCISTEQIQTVQQSAKPIANFSTTSIQCINHDILFTDLSTTPTGTITKWIWNLGNGAGSFTNSSKSSVTTKYNADGVKSVSLLVESATGCQSDTFLSTLTIHPQPLVKFGMPEVCLNDAFALFTDSTTISDGSQTQFTWAWNFNAGALAISPGPTTVTSTLQNPQIKYNKEAIYQVSLKVTTKDGCIDSTVQLFTVNGSIPVAAFDITSTAPYCGTKPVLLQNKSTVDFGAITKLEIYWDFGNNPTLKETDEMPTQGKLYPHSYPDFSLPGAKWYTIKLVAYSGGTTCTNFITKDIAVYPKPKATFTASATQVCLGDLIRFQDNSNGFSSVANKWVWNLGGGTVSTIQHPTKQYVDSGFMQVSMYFYNVDGCISDTATQLLTVYPNPILLLSHQMQVLEGGIVTLIPEKVYGKGLQYLWTPSTYLYSDTASMPKAIPTNDITYRLTITGVGGCSASDTTFVKVLKGPVVPNAFSPNGDGINDTWIIQYLEGYPGATIDVYNRYGQIVFRSTGYAVSWNGSYLNKPLPIGTYYYIINPKNGRQILTGSVTILK